jgi:hypothetical protein
MGAGGRTETHGGSPAAGREAASDTVGAIRAEYDALRAEARQRISNQLVIFAGSIALATALVPIAQHAAAATRWEIYLDYLPRKNS